MLLQPVYDGLVLVGGVVVQDGVDRPVGRHLPVDLVEERDELLVPVALGVASDHRSVQGVQCGVSLLLYLNHNIAFPSPTLTKADDGAGGAWRSLLVA